MIPERTIMYDNTSLSLMCDGFEARTVEDLKSHFSIRSVLEHYRSGRLASWLEAHDCTNELDKVQSLDNSDMVSLAQELGRIFEVTVDEHSAQSAAAALSDDSDSTVKSSSQESESSSDDARSVSPAPKDVAPAYDVSAINSYIKEYDSKIDSLLNSGSDMETDNQTVKELAEHFMPLLKKDFYSVFLRLLDRRPVTLLLLLSNPVTRTAFVHDDRQFNCRLRSTMNNNSFDSIISQMIYSSNPDLAPSSLFDPQNACCSLLDSYIKQQGQRSCLNEVFEGHSVEAGPGLANYSDLEIEPAGTPCMLLHNTCSFVRAATDDVWTDNKEWKENSARFPVLNGLHIKKKNSYEKIVYVRVPRTM